MTLKPRAHIPLSASKSFGRVCNVSCKCVCTYQVWLLRSLCMSVHGCIHATLLLVLNMLCKRAGKQAVPRFSVIIFSSLWRFTWHNVCLFACAFCLLYAKRLFLMRCCTISFLLAFVSKLGTGQITILCNMTTWISLFPFCLFCVLRQNWTKFLFSRTNIFINQRWTM